MKLPICGFDAKNAVLCPQCEGKVESGILSQSDVDSSIILANIAKSNSEIEGFTLYSGKEIKGNLILTLDKKDIMKIRQSRTIYRTLQDQFKSKIWLVEADETDEKFIEDLFFPTKILSINSVWAPGGVMKIKVVISGRWTPRFPIDTKKVVEIVKNTRNLDIEIEFEDNR
jgi:transcription antitermination factor NusA-like protein